jgi:hypothetical protein
MINVFDAKQRRSLLWLTVAALLWRWMLAARTPVPAVDGVTYLWMAQRFAVGDAAAALSEPFSPLWPALLALPIRLGIEPVLAGKLLGCLLGALTLWPVAAIAERCKPGAGLAAAVMCATARSLCLPAAEVYTEPLFAFVLAMGVLAGLREQWWRLGVWSAVAFLVRAEGVLLPLAFLTARGGYRALLPCGAAVLSFGAWRWSLDLGFDPVPKLAFHEARDDLGAARGDVGANLLQLPTVYMEAFLLPGVLAVLAWLPPRRAGIGRVWALFGLALLPMLTFVVRRRFFASWSPLVLALAGVGLTALVARFGGTRRLGVTSEANPGEQPIGSHGRPLSAGGRDLVLALSCVLDLLLGWNGVMDPDRAAERWIGLHLRDRLEAGQTVAGDMTRVLWFADQRPLPARHFEPEWFVERSHAAEVRFVVLSIGTRRESYARIAAGIADQFVPYALPPFLSDAAAERGIAVFVRR